MELIVALVFVAACVACAMVTSTRGRDEYQPRQRTRRNGRPIEHRDRYTLTSGLTPARLPDVFA